GGGAGAAGGGEVVGRRSGAGAVEVCRGRRPRAVLHDAHRDRGRGAAVGVGRGADGQLGIVGEAAEHRPDVLGVIDEGIAIVLVVVVDGLVAFSLGIGDAV